MREKSRSPVTLAVLAASLLLASFGLSDAYGEQRDLQLAPKQFLRRPAAWKQVSESRPMFYSIRSSVKVSGIRELGFIVKLDGRPILRETILVPPGAVAGNTLELLAPRPDLRERLYALDGRRTKLTLTVLVDGQEVETLSLREVVAESRRNSALRGQQLRPRKSRIVIFDPTTAGAEADPKPPLRSVSAEGWYLDPACLDWCEAQRQDCVASQCNTPICDTCNEEYDSCANGCRVCSDPVSESHTQEAWVTGWSCGGGTACIQGTFYQQCAVHYDMVDHTHTVNCDNSTSDDYDVLFPFSDSCDVATANSCPYEPGGFVDECSF